MRNINNPRHKLDLLQIEHARLKYEEVGWKVAWISIYLQVHRSSILFHVRANGWVRRVPVSQRIPDEIIELYRQRKKSKFEEKMKGSYEYIRQLAEQKRLRNCQHARWIKRCSMCNAVLETDSINHQHTAPISNATAQIISTL